MAIERVTYKIGNEELVLETGKIGKQANGCVYAQFAGSAIVATVCCASEVKEGLDFVPVTVEYNEKYYAAGKIPARGRLSRRHHTYGRRRGRVPDRRTPARPLRQRGELTWTFVS